MAIKMPVSEHELSPLIRPLINIGSTMDIPTGWFVKDYRGRWVLLGGLGALIGITGDGNTFKSTLIDHMMLSAADRLYATTKIFRCGTYDTECNIHADRKRSFVSKFRYLSAIDNPISRGYWEITDEAIALADEFWDIEKKYLRAKKAMGKDIMVNTPFMNHDKSRMQIIMPTFGQVDSLSKLTPKNAGEMADEKSLSERQVIEMRAGGARKQFLNELPRTCAGYMHYMAVSAHQGESINMQQGPVNLPPKKKMVHQKDASVKVKGVSDAFFYLTTAFWETRSAKPHLNNDYKIIYPYDSSETNLVRDADVCEVVIENLRGKSGKSGAGPLKILVSQQEGVLSELTEFYLINQTRDDPKRDPGYGLVGSNQNYASIFLPELKLSRTNIRRKLEDSLALRRAVNITSEVAQMHQRYRHMRGELLSVTDMHKNISELGYSWGEILEQTRGWWTVNEEELENAAYDSKQLSTMDMMDMAKGMYIPYWMENPPQKAVDLYNSKHQTPWKYQP